jgi:hypothetical protein
MFKQGTTEKESVFIDDSKINNGLAIVCSH